MFSCVWFPVWVPGSGAVIVQSNFKSGALLLKRRILPPPPRLLLFFFLLVGDAFCSAFHRVSPTGIPLPRQGLNVPKVNGLKKESFCSHDRIHTKPLHFQGEVLCPVRWSRCPLGGEWNRESSRGCGCSSGIGPGQGIWVQGHRPPHRSFLSLLPRCPCCSPRLGSSTSDGH